MSFSRGLAVSLLLLGLTTGVANAASLSVYISAPKVMSTQISGATTETFDAASLLTSTATTYDSAIGTYTVAEGSVLPVVQADQYGGANGSDYMYVGTRRAADAIAVTLTLDSPVNYFGFWWSAGDAKNRISIYQGDVLIATFQTSDITGLLPKNSQLTALDGVTHYATNDYYGNPNSAFIGQASNEPFAYVNIVATGFQFDRIVLDNNGASGFENDNHSVYSGATQLSTTFSSSSLYVKVKDVPLAAQPVPEPGYAGLLGLALVGFGALRARRARR